MNRRPHQPTTDRVVEPTQGADPMSDIRFALALITLACDADDTDAIEHLAAMTAEIRRHDDPDNIAMALALVAAQLVRALDEIDQPRRAGRFLLQSFGLTTERLSTTPELLDTFRHPTAPPRD